MFKIFNIIFFLFLILINKSHADIVKEVRILNNERITKETILVFSDIKIGKIKVLSKSTQEVELVLEIEETSDFPNWMGATIHQRTMNLEAVGDKRFYRINISD